MHTRPSQESPPANSTLEPASDEGDGIALVVRSSSEEETKPPERQVSTSRIVMDERAS